jgi:hypothetical protein
MVRGERHLVEGTASAKALKFDHDRCIQGIRWPLWLTQSEVGQRVGTRAWGILWGNSQVTVQALALS